MSTILTGVSNLKEFLENWSNEGYQWPSGAFWSPETGIILDDVSGDYAQWGNGIEGGNGVLLEGNDSFHYDQEYHNVSGNVSALTFGNNFSASNEDGIGLVAELTLTLDQSFDYSGDGDAFDLAIRDIYEHNRLSGLYNYLAETGAVIADTAGDDVLVGFAGEDRFIFSGGNDVIANDEPAGTYGYQDGIDLLDVTLWGATSFDDLEIYDDAGDSYVEYNGKSIRLAGVEDSSVLDASDFIFATQQSDYGLAA